MNISRFVVRILIVPAMALLSLTAGCPKPAVTQDGKVDYYTCTMHPSVREKEPGKCPICSMDLVPVYKKGAGNASANTAPVEFTVPVARQQQIGVTWATVEKRSPEANVKLHLNGGSLLSIPESAVLPTGTRFLVFVDKGGGQLEPRFVKLGPEYTETDERYYKVLGGLAQGERVVASANFLIDAESKIQGALQTWTEDFSAGDKK